ncbi:MAG: ABC transporter substrate-binding protein [Chloroflexi bacterium]|nr:ABC transporter substrate-binding protein [Chloroflexota bacterium]
MMKAQKLFGLALTGMLVVAFSLAACAPPQLAPQLTLRIGILGTQDSLPYLIMREQGIDKKFGLQFIETIYPSGAAIIDALAGGSLDVGATVGSTPVLTAAEQGLIPDKIIPAAANTLSPLTACKALPSRAGSSKRE